MAMPSWIKYPPTEMVAKTIFSLRVGNPVEKFPARFARAIKRLVASKPTIAITRLEVGE